jgi:hypothetical protein
VVVLIVSARRWTIADRARWPGHADPAFYYGIAQNIRGGHGANIHYVWEFLSPLPSGVNHYAFGYWTPLVAVLMSLALHFGSGVSAAVHLNIVMSVALAVVTYAFARQVIRSPWLRATAAVLVLVLPAASTYTMTLETPVYFATFATGAIAAAVAARSKPGMWLLAGVFAGLAHLTRSEGLLLMAVLAVAAIAWSQPGRAARIRSLTVLVAPYLLVMLPLLVASIANIGSPLPSAASKFPFITRYENLFSLHVSQSPSALFAGGIGEFASLRGHALTGFVQNGVQAMNGVVLLAILFFGIAGVGRTFAPPVCSDFAASLRLILQSVWFVPVGFVTAVVLFDVVVAPVVSGAGAVPKVMVGLSVPIVVTCLALAERLGLHERTLMVLCGILVVFPLCFVNAESNQTVALNNTVGRAAANLGDALAPERICLAQPIVLMTRSPWEFTQATGIPSVQIPNGSMDDILQIAHRYQVTDLQWTPLRGALAPIRVLAGPNGPLVPSRVDPRFAIYRIRSTTGGSKCA